MYTTRTCQCTTGPKCTCAMMLTWPQTYPPPCAYHMLTTLSVIMCQQNNSFVCNMSPLQEHCAFPTNSALHKNSQSYTTGIHQTHSPPCAYHMLTMLSAIMCRQNNPVVCNVSPHQEHHTFPMNSAKCFATLHCVKITNHIPPGCAKPTTTCTYHMLTMLSAIMCQQNNPFMYNILYSTQNIMLSP
jgi:hypothetical protein